MRKSLVLGALIATGLTGVAHAGICLNQYTSCMSSAQNQYNYCVNDAAAEYARCINGVYTSCGTGEECNAQYEECEMAYDIAVQTCAWEQEADQDACNQQLQECQSRYRIVWG